MSAQSAELLRATSKTDWQTVGEHADYEDALKSVKQFEVHGRYKWAKHTGRVAAPASLKSENICRDPKSLINLAIEHPTATPPTTVDALAVWDVWGDPNVLMV